MCGLMFRYHYSLLCVWMMIVLGNAMSFTGSNTTVPLSSDYSDDPVIPKYRIYVPTSKTFVAVLKDSNRVAAVESYPFQLNIDWEWMELKELRGLLLRDHLTRKYLCFTDNGVPIVQSDFTLDFCLLTANNPKNMDVIELPGLLRLARGSYMTDQLGYCPNGHPYIRSDPYNEKCLRSDLDLNWDHLVVCPIIPSKCRTSACMSNEEIYGRHQNCSEECHMTIHCNGLLEY